MIGQSARYALTENCGVLDVRDLKLRVAGGPRSGDLRALAASQRWMVKVPGRLVRTALGVSPGFERPTQQVAVTCTPCRYGGYRVRFSCPCGRRCGKLYLLNGGTRLACRQCHQLRYRSQRLAPLDRWQYRAAKFVARLGGEDDDGRVSRPRWMHWRTYRARLATMRAMQNAALGDHLSRIDRWIERRGNGSEMAVLAVGPVPQTRRERSGGYVLIQSKRAVAVGLLVVLFPQLVGCHHTVQRDVSTLNAPGEKPISKEQIVGVTTLTGQAYEFRKDFPVRLQDDTIVGVVGDSTQKFAVRDVQRV